jgi:hypothetical protein
MEDVTGKNMQDMRCNEDQRFLCDVIEIDGDGLFGFSEPWLSPTKAIYMEDFFDVPLASSGGLRIGEMESAALRTTSRRAFSPKSSWTASSWHRTLLPLPRTHLRRSSR